MSEPVIHVSLGISCVYLSKLTWVFGLFRQVTPRWTSEQLFAFISLLLRRRSHVMAVPAEPNTEALANLMEAFYYAFRFFVHLLMVWVCHVPCVSFAFSVPLCSRPARIVSLFPGLFIFVYSRFAPCTLCSAHLGILFFCFALLAYLCLSR